MGIRIVVGALAALAAGMALGAVSRGLMALVTVASGGENSFSWSGTAFILVLYVLVMVPGGVVAGVTTKRRRWLLPVAGALFLCLPAIGVAAEEVGSTVGFGPLQWLGVGITGTAVFATIAALPLLTVRLTDRWLGRRSAGPGLPAPAAALSPR
ncbi:hypothetical protein [Modestobacter lapidis]|nr:hypothetical protein [Modestobacter lapidis]